MFGGTPRLRNKNILVGGSLKSLWMDCQYFVCRLIDILQYLAKTRALLDHAQAVGAVWLGY